MPHEQPDNTYISHNGQFANGIQDLKPDANVLDTLRDRPSEMGQQFLAVQSHFKDVVQEGKERSQWERRHKHGHKPILKNCNERKKST